MSLLNYWIYVWSSFNMDFDFAPDCNINSMHICVYMQVQCWQKRSVSQTEQSALKLASHRAAQAFAFAMLARNLGRAPIVNWVNTHLSNA